nr:unnamed protein product [Callosobruchus analis]
MRQIQMRRRLTSLTGGESNAESSKFRYRKRSTSKRVNILDADFEEQVLKWYNEIDSDCSDIENEDVCIESDHNSESKQDVDELASDDNDTEYLPDTENTEVSDEGILSEGFRTIMNRRQLWLSALGTVIIHAFPKIVEICSKHFNEGLNLKLELEDSLPSTSVI